MHLPHFQTSQFRLVESCWGIGLILGVSTALLSGCSSQTKLYVNNYPGFFSGTNSYESIAVAGVSNDVQPGRYTRQLNSDVVNGLRKNGFYTVADYTREDMSDSELLSSLRASEEAELAVFSTVTDYGEQRNERIETRKEEEVIYAVDRDGNTLYDDDGNAIIDHVNKYDVEYPVFERTSYADMSVTVVDVQSGNSLYNSVRHGSCYEEALDPRDMSSHESARWCALDKAVASEIYQICPTFDVIYVDEDNILGIYRLDAEEGWQEDTTFKMGDKMQLVFWFPKDAYFNTFKFDIVYGDDVVLLSDQIYWEGKQQAFEYDVQSLVEGANGEQRFTIRLWNGKNIAFTKKFKVR